MNKGIAYAIFNDIKSEKYTPIEKVIAINEILGMETHNSVTKEKIIDAFRWFCDSEEIEQPKTDWIPCEERLPECEWGSESEELMYQLKDTDSIEVGYYGEGGRYRDKYFRTYRDYFEGVDASDVIAWQPLPAPYKKEGAE